MKNQIYSLMAAAALLAAGACSENWDFPTEDQGQLALNSLNVEVSNAEKVISTPGSRAAYDVSAFILTIKDEQGAQTKQYVYSEMPEIVTLPAGNYSVDVVSHSAAPKAAWDSPYFKGSADFKVEKDKITNDVVVECKFAAVKVTVLFDPSLAKRLSDDAVVSVVANDLGRLDFSKTESRAGYFEALEGSNTMAITLKGSIDGQPIESTTTYKDIAAGQHRQITFGTKPMPDVPEPNGTINIGDGLVLDVTYDDENLSGGVTAPEETIDPGKRPGTEDPKDPDTEDPNPPTPPADEPIKFHSDFIDLNGVNTDLAYNEDRPALVLITAEKGIAHLNVTINSEPLYDALVDMGLADPFDLCYPSSEELAEQISGSLGLPCGEEVIDSTEVEFNITTFVPLLSSFSGDHEFTIKVTDNEGNEDSVTLKFKS